MSNGSKVQKIKIGEFSALCNDRYYETEKEVNSQAAFYLKENGPGKWYKTSIPGLGYITKDLKEVLFLVRLILMILM